MSTRTPLSAIPKKQRKRSRSHPYANDGELAQSPAKKRFKRASISDTKPARPSAPATGGVISVSEMKEEEMDISHFLDQYEQKTLKITRCKDVERFEYDDDEDAFEEDKSKLFKFNIYASPTTDNDENGVYLSLAKLFKILKYSPQIQKKFMRAFKRNLKRSGNQQKFDSFFAKYRGKIWVSEKGWCYFIKWLSEYDGLSKFAQHFCVYRFHYRSKIFGTKGIRKKQNLENEIMICSECGLEDLHRNFGHDNACDCGVIIHKTCEKVKYIATDENNEFCSICRNEYDIETLKERKKTYAESGDFEVEQVMDYDADSSEYFVKWKYYPHAANCHTQLAASFIDAVNEFWQQSDEKIPKQAQNDIDALNIEMDQQRSSKLSQQMEDVQIDKKCDEQPEIMQEAEESEPECNGDVDVEMKNEEIKDYDEETQQNVEEIGKGKFIPVKLSDVMPKEFIIRRQFYTPTMIERYRATIDKYRQFLVKEINKQSAIGRDVKRMMIASGEPTVLPKYHLRAIKQDWDCTLPRIRDIILTHLKRKWKQLSHEQISCDKVVLAQIIDPENPALKHGGDQGVHAKKAYGLFAIDVIKKDTLLFEYAGVVKPIGQASKKLDHLEHELSQTTLFDLIGHLDEKNRNKLFWGKAPNDQLVIDPSKHHNEGVYMNDYRDNVLDDPDDDEEVDDNEQNDDKSTKCASGRRQNVKFYEILVNNWPRVFAVAMCDIEPGEELLGDYGPDFWKHFRCMMKRQMQLKEIKERVRKEVNDEWQIKYDDLKREFDAFKEKMNDKTSNDSN